MALKDEIVSTGVRSLAQLLGHGIRIRRSHRALPEVPDSEHRAAIANAERVAAEYKGKVTAEPGRPKPFRIPKNLFEAIEGHDMVRSILRRALEATEPVHVLLEGPPGSGKTQLLQAIATLPQTRYSTGPTISSSGLFTYLLEHEETRRLVIDEIEKASEPDLYVLLTLMESGRLTRLQHRAAEDVPRKVSIFAAANDASSLPEPLLARFVVLRLHPYTQAEAAAITERVLIKRERIPPTRAREIARKVAARSRDPRDAIQVARLTRGGEAIEPVLEQVVGEQTIGR